MTDPTNYIIGQANPTPFASLAQGVQLGSAINQNQFQQQQQQAQVQAQQAQQQQAQQRQALLNNLANNPNATASDFAHVMISDPALSEHLQKAWTVKNTAQQQAATADALQWGSAIANDQPQIAADMMNAKADAMEKSAGGPTADSQALRTHAQVAVEHPQFALGQIQALLASNPDGKQAADTLSALLDVAKKKATLPAEVSVANSDAAIKGAQAKVAGATLPEQIAAPGLKNQQTQQEIAASKIAGNVSEANSMTDRGKLVLDRDKFNLDAGQKNQEKGQTAQSAMDNANQALTTITSLLNHPGLDSVVGKIGGASVNAKIPGTDAADFMALLNTANSQQFVTNIQVLKGMGALSDAEGKKIQDAVASLNTDQSKGSFRTAGKVIQTTLQRAIAKAQANPSLPTSGGAFVMKSPTYGVVDDGRINRVLQQNPGATRDQVIQFLQGQ